MWCVMEKVIRRLNVGTESSRKSLEALIRLDHVQPLTSSSQTVDTMTVVPFQIGLIQVYPY
jgi:hypothetical protein